MGGGNPSLRCRHDSEHDSMVVKSHAAVSPELKQVIQDAVEKFESEIPKGLKDWHPGSEEQVWDLVHPSLHCWK